jgi:hypothetical protein
LEITVTLITTETRAKTSGNTKQVCGLALTGLGGDGTTAGDLGRHVDEGAGAAAVGAARVLNALTLDVVSCHDMRRDGREEEQQQER